MYLRNYKGRMNIKSIINKAIRYMVSVLQVTNLTLYLLIVSAYDYKTKIQNENITDRFQLKRVI